SCHDGAASRGRDRPRGSQCTAEGHPRDAQFRRRGSCRGCLVPCPRARPMRGAALPPALLCVALGLGLASARGKTAVLGLAVLVVTASAIALTTVPESWSDSVFLGCWMSIIASAAIGYAPWTLQDKAALALSLNAGIWPGALIALAASKVGLLEALPFSLCAWPGAWARRRGEAIGLKVIASWLIGVAVLAATLQFLPATPGYRP